MNESIKKDETTEDGFHLFLEGFEWFLKRGGCDLRDVVSSAIYHGGYAACKNR